MSTTEIFSLYLEKKGKIKYFNFIFSTYTKLAKIL